MLDASLHWKQEHLGRRGFSPGTKQVPKTTALYQTGLHQAGEFRQAPAHGAAQFQPKEQQIGDQPGPDLDADGILGGPGKSLDLQML